MAQLIRQERVHYDTNILRFIKTWAGGDLGGLQNLELERRNLERENAALSAQVVELQKDAERCICKGNWQLILKESEGLIDSKFKDEKGDVYTFFGIVHGSDDYYYGMWREGNSRLLSCVGSIEGHGFTLVDTGTASTRAENE